MLTFATTSWLPLSGEDVGGAVEVLLGPEPCEGSPARSMVPTQATERQKSDSDTGRGRRDCEWLMPSNCAESEETFRRKSTGGHDCKRLMPSDCGETRIFFKKR